ncbi:Fc receptor-like protein 5 [Misgurnus anguillicaudatus]|uniref:Fc receptor-like protein 5 n=1 Tax=Misgurnus anguillicaudatus TaxID=75329 RepID=UPI003CCF8754
MAFTRSTCFFGNCNKFFSLFFTVLILNIPFGQAEEITPTLTVKPQTSVFIGDTVTLICEIHQSTGWEFIFIIPSNTAYHEFTEPKEAKTKIIRSVQVSDGGEYWCRARRKQNPQIYTQDSKPITLTVQDITPTLTVQPQTSVFIGDSVTLICEMKQSSGWEFLFTRPPSTAYHKSTEPTGTKIITAVQVSDGGEYKCRARKRENPQVYTQYSEPTIVTVQNVKPTLTVEPKMPLFIGDSVTLTCEVHQATGWEFFFVKPPNPEYYKATGTKTTRSVQSTVKVSEGGKYKCRAGRGDPQVYTQYSEPITVTVQERPTPLLSVDPDKLVFRGETVTLTCVINGEGVSSWQYSWNKTDSDIQQYEEIYTIRSVTESDAGKYTCKGTETRESRYSHISNTVTLTVSDKPQTVLSVSPQQWLTEGDSVTLMCEVRSSSTGWTFSWFTVPSPYSVNRDELVSNSSGGSKGIYTVSSVTVKHTGVYMCRAERGDPVYHTENSNTQTLWITDVSPSVSLIIRPDRSQHFSSKSLSLSCEDHSNSTGWTVRRYTDKLKPCSSSISRSTETTFTCTISSLKSSDTGVYWCQSDSGEKLHPVNISVHNDGVILDSPVHPVTEGDPLTLRCLYRDKKPSNLRAEFYKNGSVVQNQTTGDMMIISTVSKSHEGFYYCKHPERGESPKSWIAVRPSSSASRGLIYGVGVGLSIMFLIIFLVLLWIYKNRKGKVSQSPSAVSPQQNISQTSEQKQSEEGYTPLQSGDAHIYDSVDVTNNKDTSTGVTQAGLSYVQYSQVNLKKNKLKNKDTVSEAADITYADIELKPKKEVKTKKKKGNTREGDDTVYSKVKTSGDKGVVSGSDDLTYAQIK